MAVVLVSLIAVLACIAGYACGRLHEVDAARAQTAQRVEEASRMITSLRQEGERRMRSTTDRYHSPRRED